MRRFLGLSKEREPFVNGAEGCVRETRKGVLHDDDQHFSELFEALKNASACRKGFFDKRRDKFSQNPDLLTLIKTHSDKIFVEASPVDLIWGVGLHENDDLILDESNWTGLNKLGNALTTVAQLLKDLKC